MFKKQMDYYKRHVEDVKKKMGTKDVVMLAKSINFDLDTLEEAFKSNTNEFKKFGYVLAKSIVSGAVSSDIYAGVVAFYAEKYNLDYKVYTGFCMPNDHPKHDDAVRDFDNKKESGAEHPMLPNHVFIEIDDKFYELFENEFSNIDHIDFVEIRW